MSKEKKFIFATLIQIITISVAYISISEYIIRRYVLPLDSSIKAARIFKNSMSPNVIWGDSQTHEGLNNLDKFINLSFGADSYQEINIKVKKYYSRIDDTNSKRAILLLGYNSFGENYNEINNSLLSEIFLSDNQKPTFYFFKSYFRKRSYRYIANFFKNGFKILPSKNIIFNEDGSQSIKKIHNSAKYFNNIKNEKNKFNDKNISYRLLEDLLEDSLYIKDYKESPNYNALLKIIEYFKKEGIDTCYITTPRHKDIRKFMKRNKIYSEISDFYKRLAIDKDLTYFNFTEVEYPSSYFSDPVHLNYLGAQEFTKLVKEKCFPYFNDLQ